MPLFLKRENLEPMPGYLSLHAVPHTLLIKWTPNNLMNNGRSESPPDGNQEQRYFQDFFPSIKWHALFRHVSDTDLQHTIESLPA